MQVYDIPIDQNNKKEATLHGSYAFPMAIYETIFSKNVLGFVNWHWHEELQFCVVLEGHGDFHVNQNTYLLQAGDGIFINSGILHMVQPYKDPNSKYVCINVDYKVLSSFPGSILEHKYVKPIVSSPQLQAIPFYQNKQWHATILSVLSRINQLYTEKSFAYEIDITMYLYQIWKLLALNISSDNMEQDEKIQADSAKMKVIFSYIEEHYMDKITLEEIARLIHFSRSECCRMFKRIAGCTLFEYIMDIRVNKSIGFLTQTDMTISQVAHVAGFASTSYFIESFKKKIHCTPKEYREKYWLENRQGNE